MRGYLLDTQTVCYWFDKNAAEHANVNVHIRAVPAETPINISVVTIGEIEYGLTLTDEPDENQQDALRDFIRENFPVPFEISKATPAYYAAIRAKLFSKYPPQGKKKRPEKCYDTETASELGIDENDLWIASQAYEHGLVLVTNDKMKRIREVSDDLIQVENWTKPRQ